MSRASEKAAREWRESGSPAVSRWYVRHHRPYNRACVWCVYAPGEAAPCAISATHADAITYAQRAARRLA